MKWRFLVLFIVVCYGSTSIAQTCCTGGVPHLAGLRIPQTNYRQIGTSVSYIYNDNRDLFLNNSEVNSSNIYRKVNSMLVQGDYGISDKFAVSLILPFIFQREIISLNDEARSYSNSGFGDVSIWGNYKNEIANRLFLSTSVGIKIPTGNTNQRDDITGIPLPFSFQTGSGSTDFGILAFLKYSLDKQKLYHLLLQLTTKFNTKGDKFEAHPNYLFGNIYQWTLLIDRSFISDIGIINLSLGNNFQFREKDVFDGGFENQNSGGTWINAVAVGTIAFSPSLNLSVNGFIPIYRHLNGLQLTTSWMATIGLGYVFM